MTHDSKPPKRRSIRIKNYDYRIPGSYFITICTHNKKCLFGQIKNEKIQLYPIGKIVFEYWQQIPLHFHNVSLDVFTVMPNHIHGILEITRLKQTIKHTPDTIQKNSISSIIRAFKAAVTQQSRKITKNYTLKVWQRNYYEHIIRNETSKLAIQEYIINNPLKWELDSLYVDHCSAGAKFCAPTDSTNLQTHKSMNNQL